MEHAEKANCLPSTFDILVFNFFLSFNPQRVDLEMSDGRLSSD